MRWKEEVRLLEEEMRRTLRFHSFHRDQWEARARKKVGSQELGAAAYARKCIHVFLHVSRSSHYTYTRQAFRYNRLIHACKKRFDQHIHSVSLRSPPADVLAHALNRRSNRTILLSSALCQRTFTIM